MNPRSLYSIDCRARRIAAWPRFAAGRPPCLSCPDRRGAQLGRPDEWVSRCQTLTASHERLSKPGRRDATDRPRSRSPRSTRTIAIVRGDEDLGEAREIVDRVRLDRGRIRIAAQAPEWTQVRDRPRPSPRRRRHPEMPLRQGSAPGGGRPPPAPSARNPTSSGSAIGRVIEPCAEGPPCVPLSLILHRPPTLPLPT
jgi:hypothetical protein